MKLICQQPYFMDFSKTRLGECIAKSSAKTANAPLLVTSGELVSGTHLGTKTGFTKTHNFRMLLNPFLATGERIAWDNYRFTATLLLDHWLPQRTETPAWSGLHLFARYNTENDLYVASLRKDGLIVIKKKIGGEYTTLASTKAELMSGKWYVLTFQVENANLLFFVDGVLVLQAKDADLSSGTSGVRFDYAAVHVKDLRVHHY